MHILAREDITSIACGKRYRLRPRNATDDIHAEPTTAGPERPKVREFAREGSLEAAPEVGRLPVRYRPPRRLGSAWAG